MKPDALQTWMSAAGGRRFLMTAGAGIVHTGLLIWKYISEQTYLTLTISTIAVYIGANTAQKIKEIKSA